MKAAGCDTPGQGATRVRGETATGSDVAVVGPVVVVSPGSDVDDVDDDVVLDGAAGNVVVVAPLQPSVTAGAAADASGITTRPTHPKWDSTVCVRKRDP